jgi:hypothetical protein
MGRGVAVPPLVRSAQASKEDKKQMCANAPMSLQSAERKGRVRWMERHSHRIPGTLR